MMPKFTLGTSTFSLLIRIHWKFGNYRNSPQRIRHICSKGSFFQSLQSWNHSEDELSGWELMLNASQETLYKLRINWSPPLRNQGLLEGEKSPPQLGIVPRVPVSSQGWPIVVTFINLKGSHHPTLAYTARPATIVYCVDDYEEGRTGSLGSAQQGWLNLIWGMTWAET